MFGSLWVAFFLCGFDPPKNISDARTASAAQFIFSFIHGVQPWSPELKDSLESRWVSGIFFLDLFSRGGFTTNMGRLEKVCIFIYM